MPSAVKTSTSYAGRQLDLESLQSVGSPSATYTEVVPSVTYEVPKIVAGPQKLVQRYAVLFTTLTGSDVLDSDFGTDLYRVFESGNVSGRSSLHLYAEAANRLTKERILADDADEDTFGKQPDDEKLDDCRVDDVSVDTVSRKISVRVSIRTAAGISTTFIVPTKSGIY